LKGDALIHMHLNWAVSLARGLARRLYPAANMDDVEQAGLLGLTEAARRYDPVTGTVFRSYASMHVRGRVHDMFRRGRIWEEHPYPLLADVAVEQDDYVSGVQRARQARRLMATLTPRQQRVVYAVVIQERTPLAASRVLHMRVEDVIHVLAGALDQMRARA
jgi:RNA polymerase sigma factor (sigma-70 family)